MSDDWLVDLDRPGSPPPAGPAGTATRARARAAALALAAVAVLAVGLVALPRAQPAVVEVRRLSADVLPGDVPSVVAGAGPGATLTVSLEVTTRPAGTAADVTGLIGPGVVGSRVLTAGTDPAARSVQVSLDCRFYLAGAPVGDLSLDLRTTDTSGHRARARKALAGSARSVGPVARRACWTATAAAGIAADRLTARAGDGRRVDVSVELRNRTGRDVTVTAVDVTDGDTRPGAGARVLADGTQERLTVRLPVERCSLPVADDAVPSSLVWAVGPAGGEPVTFAVRLDAEQQRTLRSAVRDVCGDPPSLDLHLVSARVLDDPLVVDPRGRSVLLRLRVGPGPRRILELGDHTGGLTADARPAFTGATAQVGAAPADTELVWHTRCGGRIWPPSGAVVLPVRTTVRGLTYAWSVPLDGRMLGDALRPSCT